MRYELKVIYLNDESTYAYMLKNTDTDAYFEWTVGNIKATRFLLTDNRMIIRASYINKQYVFEVVKGKEKISNEGMVYSNEGAKLVFECDAEDISIVYDYYNLPDLKHEIIGSIVGVFLIENEGGFFESESDYEDLEEKVGDVLDKYGLIVTEEISKDKPSVKKEKRSKNTEEVKTKTEANVVEVIEEPTKKTTRKRVKKEDK